MPRELADGAGLLFRARVVRLRGGRRRGLRASHAYARRRQGSAAARSICDGPRWKRTQHLAVAQEHGRTRGHSVHTVLGPRCRVSCARNYSAPQLQQAEGDGAQTLVRCEVLDARLV